jgi:hypothetical protein
VRSKCLLTVMGRASLEHFRIGQDLMPSEIIPAYERSAAIANVL